MKHFYENIHGWFDYADLYAAMVDKHNSGAHFVEVGAWKGKSAAFMGVEIRNCKKQIAFDTIDHFIGVEAPKHGDKRQRERFLDNYRLCRENLKLLPEIQIIPLPSRDAVQLYADESLDFVFIDANHAYAWVLRDLQLWFPKVKPGGYFAGHDYTSHAGVRRAVDDLFPSADQVSEKCWMIQKH